MKVAVSIEEGKGMTAPVCQTFGRAPWFVVVDDTTGGMTFVANTAASGAHGAGTGAASLMARHGVDAVISGRFGPNAFEALHLAQIRMFVCLTDPTAQEALEQFRAGALQEVAAT
jgi:predicted Fe-Mo cluster-binding NifX family protein